MTLREKYKNLKPSITKSELDAVENLPEMKRHDLFLEMCERLEDKCENIKCVTISEVFNEIENNNVYVFNIVSKREYDNFKKLVIEENILFTPLGKPDRIFDLHNQKDFNDYKKLHGIDHISI